MNLTKTIVGLVIALSINTSANAEFVFTDYITDGDKQAIIDTDTNLTWLNLGITRGMSYDTVLESTINGELAGWRIATVEDVVTMFDNFFDLADWQSTVDMEYRGSMVGATKEVRDFAFTFGNYGQVNLNNAYGYFGYGDSVSGAGGYINDGSFTYLMTVGRNRPVDTSTQISYFGTFLVSGTASVGGQQNAVDVPAPLSLSALFLFGLGISRRKKSA